MNLILSNSSIVEKTEKSWVLSVLITFYSSKHSSCAGENTGDVRVPKTDPPVCTASQQQPPFLPKSHHFPSTLNTVMRRRESGLPPGEQMRPKPHLGRPPRAPQPVHSVMRRWLPTCPTAREKLISDHLYCAASEHLHVMCSKRLNFVF